MSGREKETIDAGEIKRIESQAWGRADFNEIERSATKSSHVIGNLLQESAFKGFGLNDKSIINVGGGHGEEAEFLLRNGVRMVALLDIAQAQLRHARFRKLKRELDGLECIRGDAEYIPFKDDSFDLGYIYMALHHFPSHINSISEICRVSREVVFIDIMNPLLTRVVTKLGFYRNEGDITPNRLNGKAIEKILLSQQLTPNVTYFFVPPVDTPNPSLTRCLTFLFKLINSVISRSEKFGLLFGNIAIISGIRANSG